MVFKMIPEINCVKYIIIKKFSTNRGNRHDFRRDNGHGLTLELKVSVVVQNHSDIERPQA
jgi:hypothetical protein